MSVESRSSFLTYDVASESSSWLWSRVHLSIAIHGNWTGHEMRSENIQSTIERAWHALILTPVAGKGDVFQRIGAITSSKVSDSEKYAVLKALTRGTAREICLL